MGLANNRSIAWGIARACADAGAELAFTYQGEALEKRVRPLAKEVNGHVVGHCDVTDSASIDAVFAELGKLWGEIDFVVHAIAFSDKDELTGRYLDTSEGNFTKSMLISCYSLTAVTQRAEKLMARAAPSSPSPITVRRNGCRTTMSWALQRQRLRQACAILRPILARRDPRQRHLRRTDQDACRLGHWRFPLYSEVERIQRAAAPHGHPGRGRRQRAVFPVRSFPRGDRRGAPCRLRLSRGRHEEPGCAGYFAQPRAALKRCASSM